MTLGLFLFVSNYVIFLLDIRLVHGYGFGQSNFEVWRKRIRLGTLDLRVFTKFPEPKETRYRISKN